MPTTSASGRLASKHATARRRKGRGTAEAVVVGLAIVLGACASESSQSAPQHLVIGSESERPSGATTAAGPSTGATSVAPLDVTTVTIRNRSFGAPEITVALGRVTFINADTDPHTVTEGQDGAPAPNARFDMVVGVGESIQVTFVEPGDYRITCLFHAEMHLLVHAH